MHRLCFLMAAMSSAVAMGAMDRTSPHYQVTDENANPLKGISGSVNVQNAVSNPSRHSVDNYRITMPEFRVAVSLPPAPEDVGLPPAPVPKPPVVDQREGDIVGFEFSRLPGDVRSVVPSNEELGIWKGVSGPKDVFNWTGAALGYAPETGNRTMYFWGGGHAGYGGNEVYAYDLVLKQWKRYGPWLDHTVGSNGCFYPTDAPQSAHSMNGLWWAHGELFVSGYSAFCSGRKNNQTAMKPNVWSFNPATEVWTPRATLKFVEPHMAYDDLRDLLYVWSRRSRLDVYDGTTFKLVQHQAGPEDYVNDDSALVLDEKRRVLYGISEGNMYVWPLNEDGTLTGAQQKVSGIPWGGNGFALRGNALYAWGGKSDVRRVDLDTFEVTAIPGGGSTIAPLFNRIVGRWKYDESTDSFFGMSAFSYLQRWGFAEDAPPVVEDPPVVDARPIVVAPPVGPEPPIDPVPGDFSEWAIDPFGPGGLVPYDATASMPGNPSATGTGGLNRAMQATGDNPAIGIVTTWQAAVLAGRSEYIPAVLYQASQEVASRLRWDAGHTYPLYWVAYLITGEEQYLDRLRGYYAKYQEWRGRSFDAGIEPLREREAAWQLRTLAELASVDPAYQKPLDATLDKWTRWYMQGGRPGRQALHVIGPEWSTKEERTDPKHVGTSVFQQAFITQTLAHVVMLGHEEWRPMLEWNFYFWQNVVKKNLNRFDINNLWYWTEEGGDRATWEAIMGPPSRDIIDDGIRHIRGAQALAAIGYCAAAGVPGARETFDKLKPLVEARAGRLRVRVTVRDAVLLGD